MSRHDGRHARAPAGMEAVSSAATLKYLDGGHGDGCNEEDDRFTLARGVSITSPSTGSCRVSPPPASRRSIIPARPARPHAWSSLPVVLGSVGGSACSSVRRASLWLNLRRHEKHGDPAQRGMDRGFIALLLLTSLSGFALLALREAASMPFWIAVHLRIVMALFLTLPYGSSRMAYSASRRCSNMRSRRGCRTVWRSAATDHRAAGGWHCGVGLALAARLRATKPDAFISSMKSRR